MESLIKKFVILVIFITFVGSISVSLEVEAKKMGMEEERKEKFGRFSSKKMIYESKPKSPCTYIPGREHNNCVGSNDIVNESKPKGPTPPILGSPCMYIPGRSHSNCPGSKDMISESKSRDPTLPISGSLCKRNPRHSQGNYHGSKDMVNKIKPPGTGACPSKSSPSGRG